MAKDERIRPVIDVDPLTFRIFRAHCIELGVTPASELGELVRGWVGEKRKSPVPAAAVARKHRGAPRKRA